MPPHTNAARRGSVSLSAVDAAEIARLLRILEATMNLPPPAPQIPEQDNRPATIPRARLLARAQAIFTERSRRTQFFNRSIFGEPAWDILLCLYIMDGRRLTVRKLARLIDAPQTTVLRWLQYLERERLIAKRADPDDRRVARIELLDHGRELLDVYFSNSPAISGLG